MTASSAWQNVSINLNKKWDKFLLTADFGRLYLRVSATSGAGTWGSGWLLAVLLLGLKRLLRARTRRCGLLVRELEEYSLPTDPRCLSKWASRSRSRSLSPDAVGNVLSDGLFDGEGDASDDPSRFQSRLRINISPNEQSSRLAATVTNGSKPEYVCVSI